MTSFDVKKEKIELLIEEKIKKNFPNSNFLIENTSSKHKKHKQNIHGDETHFIINLKSKKFFKLSKLICLDESMANSNVSVFQKFLSQLIAYLESVLG